MSKSELHFEIERLKTWILGLDSVPWEEEVSEKFKSLESLADQMVK